MAEIVILLGSTASVAGVSKSKSRSGGGRVPWVFIPVPIALYKPAITTKLGLTPQERDLIIAVLSFGRVGDVTWPFVGTQTVAKVVGRSDRSIRLISASLAKKGLLTRLQLPGRRAVEWNLSGLWDALGIEKPIVDEVANRDSGSVTDNGKSEADPHRKRKSPSAEKRKPASADVDVPPDLEEVDVSERGSHRESNSLSVQRGESVALSGPLSEKQSRVVQELKDTIGVWPSEACKIIPALGRRFGGDGTREALMLAADAAEKDDLENAAAYWQSVTRAIADGEAEMAEDLIGPEDEGWMGIPCLA